MNPPSTQSEVKKKPASMIRLLEPAFSLWVLIRTCSCTNDSTGVVREYATIKNSFPLTVCQYPSGSGKIVGKQNTRLRQMPHIPTNLTKFGCPHNLPSLRTISGPVTRTMEDNDVHMRMNPLLIGSSVLHEPEAAAAVNGRSAGSTVHVRIEFVPEMARSDLRCVPSLLNTPTTFLHSPRSFCMGPCLLAPLTSSAGAVIPCGPRAMISPAVHTSSPPPPPSAAAAPSPPPRSTFCRSGSRSGWSSSSSERSCGESTSSASRLNPVCHTSDAHAEAAMHVKPKRMVKYVCTLKFSTPTVGDCARASTPDVMLVSVSPKFMYAMSSRR
mmetsp:Transcript_12853/g.55164  ORF Transcript_12853/g.55164 Transcript_12853/m.55164 type:complete len:327 (+) Transcript_12853:489-1469(+)